MTQAGEGLHAAHDLRDTWGTTGAGVALLATGAVFLSIASGRQDEVDNHPTDTLEDLQRLDDLDSSAQRLERIGNGLLIGGGLVTATGVALLIIQAASDPDTPETRATVTPVPLRGGIGLAIELELH